MPSKFLPSLLLVMILSGCGFTTPQQPLSIPADAAQETIFLDDTPTPPASTPYPQVLPTLNPTLTAFSTRIQVVLLANADGSNAADVDQAQLMRWVDQANLVFASAGIRFLFDPGVDMDHLANDALNNTSGLGDALWEAAVTEGRQYAATAAGKMVVFLRAVPLMVDSGFNGEDFVIMPSAAPLVCGEPDDSLLAHQAGHYLGLQNTFPQVFTSLADLDKAFEDKGSTSAFFDGDGLEDTLPDPFVDLPEYRCGENANVTIGATQYPLPTGNLMSWYSPRTQLSPLQAARARYMLALRVRSGSVLPSNRSARDAIQFEDLTLYFRSWCDPQLMDLSGDPASGWSGDQYIQVPSGYGAICTFTITAPESATYELIIYTANGPDRGTAQVLLDNWFIYEALDMYSQFIMPSGPVSLGKYYLEEGDHTLAFQIINKMLESSNYHMGFDALEIRKIEP